MAQVVEHLPSNCQALSSKPSITKKQQKNTTREAEVVAYTCNLNYSGGRDQVNCGPRPSSQSISWYDDVHLVISAMRVALGKNLRPYLKYN
jgi:hypothetical protein